MPQLSHFSAVPHLLGPRSCSTAVSKPCPRHGQACPTGRATRAVLWGCVLSVLTIHVPSAALWYNRASTIHLHLETKGTLQETHPLPGNHAGTHPLPGDHEVKVPSKGFRVRVNSVQQAPASCHCLCPGTSPSILKTLREGSQRGHLSWS